MSLKRKSIPYANTTISPEQTQADIKKLLEAHEIRDVQWTTYQGNTTLKFLFKIQIKGVQKEIMFAFKPPKIAVKKRYGSSLVNTINDAVSYRLLFWYLKTKLEAVQFGLETVEQEFMSHIMVALPGGQDSTLGEKLGEITELVRLPVFSEKKALPMEENSE